jgi:hypothetical protein
LVSRPGNIPCEENKPDNEKPVSDEDEPENNELETIKDPIHKSKYPKEIKKTDDSRDKGNQ